jgi:hypothetical protein
MNIRITKFKEYNNWTVWNIPNKLEYHTELKNFLTKKLGLIIANNETTKKSNNLIEFGFIEKMKNKPEKRFKCVFLMSSKKNEKDYISLTMIRIDRKIEKMVDAKVKKITKNNFDKYKLYYFKIEFGNDFEINKRELANAYGLDYDTLHYRTIKIPGSEGGTMLIFKRAIEFLAYPSKASFEKDKKKILDVISKNLIRVNK